MTSQTFWELPFQENFGRLFSQVAEVAGRMQVVVGNPWSCKAAGGACPPLWYPGWIPLYVTMPRTPEVKEGGNNVDDGVS